MTLYQHPNSRNGLDLRPIREQLEGAMVEIITEGRNDDEAREIVDRYHGSLLVAKTDVPDFRRRGEALAWAERTDRRTVRRVAVHLQGLADDMLALSEGQGMSVVRDLLRGILPDDGQAEVPGGDPA
jgi:hypothetical protein